LYQFEIRPITRVPSENAPVDRDIQTTPRQYERGFEKEVQVDEDELMEQQDEFDPCLVEESAIKG
jgi:hypothetical protein